MSRTALVFGATGLVGSALVKELDRNPGFDSVLLFNRRPCGCQSPKIKEKLVDFTRMEEFAASVSGDDLFICLGTTIRKAGSVSAVEAADRDLPVNIATLAAANGVSRIAVVSSIGANSRSRGFYLRIKGEMEAGIRKIPFKKTVIARPSMLYGPRREFRFGELMGKAFMKMIDFTLIGAARKYRGIEAVAVARAMIVLLDSPGDQVVFESDELQQATGKYPLH